VYIFFVLFCCSWLAAWCCGFYYFLYYFFDWLFFALCERVLCGFYGPWFDCICFWRYGIYIFSCLGWHFRWQPLRQLFFRPESASNASIFVWFIVNTCGRCFLLQRLSSSWLFVLFLRPPLLFSVTFSQWVACAEWHVNQNQSKCSRFRARYRLHMLLSLVPQIAANGFQVVFRSLPFPVSRYPAHSENPDGGTYCPLPAPLSPGHTHSTRTLGHHAFSLRWPNHWSTFRVWVTP